MDLRRKIHFLECDRCQRRFGPSESEGTCPDCGPTLGTLTVWYAYDEIARSFQRETLLERREPSLWRYLEILPVPERPALLHPRVGWTPMYDLPRLAQEIGVRRLWIKDDGVNPSGSFKDRASCIGVARALLQGKTTITAASTGNAASSLALFAACAGMRAVIFVPQTAPSAKVAQLLVFGAEVLAIRGTYDQAFDLCLAAAEKNGWYCRNTAVNPFMSEGKKTAAMEICEQLGFEPPDCVVVSVGDGCIIGGLWKGFQDFLRLGLIHRLPRLYGVQAAGCAPLLTAFQQGQDIAAPLLGGHTCADSICVGQPRDHLKALRAVRQSHGAMTAVEDEAILEAIRTLARKAGVFVEPAAATAFAGLKKLVEDGLIGNDERVAVMLTGNGLKDIATALRASGREPTVIDPDPSQVPA